MSNKEEIAPTSDMASNVPSVDSNAPLKIEEEEPDSKVPEVDTDAPLKVEEEGKPAKEIPKSDVDATLEVEKLTKPTGVPDSNLSAPLKAEEVSEPHQDTKQQEGSKKLLMIGVLAGILVVLVIIGFIFLRPKVAPEKTEKPKVEKVVVEEEKKEELNRSEWPLEVLNGTSVRGAAKKLADQLLELGYLVIKTGNADKSDYTQTQLFISKDYKEKEDLLLEDLKKEINISSVSGELKDSTASARIIIGEDLADEIGKE